MVDDTAIGVPGTHPLSLPREEQVRLADAVRETRKQVTLGVIRRIQSPDLVRCPSCGDAVIILDKPQTFVLRDHEQICSACGAERDLISLYTSEADIGGEGGG